MSILKDPKKFLKKAVLLTCLVSTIAQAVPVQAITHGMAEAPTISANAIESGLAIDSQKIESKEFFKSLSMRGEAVQHVSSKSAAAKILLGGSDDYAFAAKVITDQQQGACVVSTEVPTQSRLDAQSIHFGMSESSGFITNPYLARMTTTYHEFGHCLDFTSSTAHSNNQANMNIGTFLMMGMVVNDAAMNPGGKLDFDHTLGLSREQIDAEREGGRAFLEVGVSLMETYADLHGTFQTATATGDLAGFTDFTLGFRQSEDLKLTHSTGLAVSNIIQKEISAGLDVAGLKGKSHAEVTDMVNQMFVKHFSSEGQLSIHSDGFKDVVKDMTLKIQLGADASPDLQASVKMLENLTGATPSQADKIAYVGLTQANLDRQKEMVSESNAGANPVISALLVKKDAHLDKVMTELNVEGNVEMSMFKGQDAYKQSSFRVASRMAMSNAVDKTGIQVNQGKAIDLLRTISNSKIDNNSRMDLAR